MNRGHNFLYSFLYYQIYHLTSVGKMSREKEEKDIIKSNQQPIKPIEKIENAICRSIEFSDDSISFERISDNETHLKLEILISPLILKEVFKNVLEIHENLNTNIDIMDSRTFRITI
jgi:hypothetical protein